MIKLDRYERIVSILEEAEELSIPELARRLGGVSSVTVRRDVSALASAGRVRRRHGSVSRAHPQKAVTAGNGDNPIHDQLGHVDALILPPIEGRGADTLRSIARRRRIPFLAESSPQDGGTYVGPDNFSVGRELGNRAGRTLSGKLRSARILLVSLERLPNTRSRCDGFIQGFTETFDGTVKSWRVDGRGAFKIAFSACQDVFAVHPEINVAFGVNDHSVLAAIEAAEQSDIERVEFFNVGGEGGALFDVLKDGRKLKACAALFPEVVGILAVDALASALTGAPLAREIRTPHVILTPETLGQYYRRQAEGWHLFRDAEERLLAGHPVAPPSRSHGAIGFVPHYPAHDWYRNMIRSMQRRADDIGLELRIAAPQAGIAREIGALRRQIACCAADRVLPGDTIIIDGGPIGLMLADEIDGKRDVTVVTNALDIMERLSGRPGLKVILTSGEYHARSRCLVGPSLGALFETLRVDKAFLSVDGVTARFGPSRADERLALASRRFVAASHQAIVLADHSLIGVDANNRIVPPGTIDEIITDSSSLPADRLALAAAGSVVTVAENDPREDAPSSIEGGGAQATA